MKRALGTATVLLLLCVACGGGGGGGGDGGGTGTIWFASTTLPGVVPGQQVDIPLAIEGGCGGPYALRILTGALPAGITLDDSAGAPAPRHHLTGSISEKGIYDFQLSVTDTGCSPPATNSAWFRWDCASFLAAGDVRTGTSGDAVDYEIVLTGGCGGAFTGKVVDGALPLGVEIDCETIGQAPSAVHRHHLLGRLEEPGNYDFTVELRDFGCSEVTTAWATFSWTVNRGPIRIISAIPKLILQADYVEPDKWTDVDALATVAWDDYISGVLNVVGGDGGPYRCTVADDPFDPDDDAKLPQFVNILQNSCFLVGAPIEHRPDGRPWRIAFRIYDKNGNSDLTTLQWQIGDEPPP